MLRLEDPAVEIWSWRGEFAGDELFRDKHRGAEADDAMRFGVFDDGGVEAGVPDESAPKFNGAFASDNLVPDMAGVEHEAIEQVGLS